MVNDGTGKQLNSVMRVVSVNNAPHLCLFALRDIPGGEELRFDYGDNSVPCRRKVQYNLLSITEVYIVVTL